MEYYTGSDVVINSLPHIKKELHNQYGVILKWNPSPYSYSVLVNGSVILAYENEIRLLKGN